MIVLTNRQASLCFLVIVLLFLPLASACKRSADVRMDPRAEFVRSLKGANVDGFFFATKEDAKQVITSLLNPTMREPVQIDEANPLVIGYAGLTDKKTNTTKTYQAVIVKSDNIFRFHVKDVDLGGGLVVDERVLPRPCPGQTTF